MIRHQNQLWKKLLKSVESINPLAKKNLFIYNEYGKYKQNIHFLIGGKIKNG